jgi:hypothetical protein
MTTTARFIAFLGRLDDPAAIESGITGRYIPLAHPAVTRRCQAFGAS